MEDRFISETELGLYVDLDSGFSPKYEVAGDKFIVGGNGALGPVVQSRIKLI